MVFGIPPFYHQNHKHASLEKLSLNKLILPTEMNGISPELKDLLRSLLSPNPRERLGWKDGILEIQDHSWFKKKILITNADSSPVLSAGSGLNSPQRRVSYIPSPEFDIAWDSLSVSSNRSLVDAKLHQKVLENLYDEDSALLGKFHLLTQSKKEILF